MASLFLHQYSLYKLHLFKVERDLFLILNKTLLWNLIKKMNFYFQKGEKYSNGKFDIYIKIIATTIFSYYSVLYKAKSL